MDTKKMASLVYDLLMDNSQHPQFDYNAVRDQNLSGHFITFRYDDQPFVIIIQPN